MEQEAPAAVQPETAPEEPALSREEALALAEQNRSLLARVSFGHSQGGFEQLVVLLRASQSAGDSFAAKDQLMEAVDAYCQALECAEKAYGSQAPETGPFYHKYGSTLMRLTNRQTEEAFSDAIVGAMRDQGENQEKKLTNDELETAAAEHADDFDEAWEALEVARMVFEKAEQPREVAKVRMSLGDACGEVDQWDDAAKEYGEAAAILKGLEPDGRQTVEAIFLTGLALQMINEREKCVSAICDARDTMQRLVDANAGSSEAEELRGILDDLNAKVAEVQDEKTWEQAADNEALDRDMAGEEDAEPAEASNKRLIIDDENEAEGEKADADEESAKRRKTDNDKGPEEGAQ